MDDKTDENDSVKRRQELLERIKKLLKHNTDKIQFEEMSFEELASLESILESEQADKTKRSRRSSRSSRLDTASSNTSLTSHELMAKTQRLCLNDAESKSSTSNYFYDTIIC
jgi:hypothetical protein